MIPETGKITSRRQVKTKKKKENTTNPNQTCNGPLDAFMTTKTKISKNPKISKKSKKTKISKKSHIPKKSKIPKLAL